MREDLTYVHLPRVLLLHAPNIVRVPEEPESGKLLGRPAIESRRGEMKKSEEANLKQAVRCFIRKSSVGLAT